jgi:hypothetical protein
VTTSLRNAAYETISWSVAQRPVPPRRPLRQAPAVPFAPLATAPVDPAALGADTDDPDAGQAGAPGLTRLLSSAEVGDLFNRSERTLRRWVRLGHLVPVRIGGALFFDPRTIRRLIAGRLCEAILAARGGRGGPVADGADDPRKMSPKRL